MRTVGEEQGRLSFGVGGRSQHGVVAAGMEAEDDLGAWRFLHAQALSADRNTAITADSEGRAHAPDINPPGTARGRAQHGAVFFFGLVPGVL